jgi:hypothetical protein
MSNYKKLAYYLKAVTAIRTLKRQSTNPDLSVKDVFDIYQKQSESVHKLWAYFQIVSLAVLGYTLGTEKTLWSVWTYAFVAASYGIFGFANQWVLVLSQRELKSISDGLAIAVKSAGPVGQKLIVSAVKPWKVWLFHFASIVAVLVAIFTTWLDKRPLSNHFASPVVEPQKLVNERP